MTQQPSAGNWMIQGANAEPWGRNSFVGFSWLYLGPVDGKTASAFKEGQILGLGLFEPQARKLLNNPQTLLLVQGSGYFQQQFPAFLLAGQMVKLVESSGKAITGIMASSISGTPVKIIKSSTVAGENSRIYTASVPQQQPQQIIRGLPTGGNLVTKQVPIQMNQLPKGTKTIRLTPAQMVRPIIHYQSQGVGNRAVCFVAAKLQADASPPATLGFPSANACTTRHHPAFHQPALPATGSS
ncbi:hypothetical protein HUJ04_005660 [Dendroctonus ponderosae]|nr:hypothetical protein HUJ04_005660 [Dendroctonus ponderosae]KAH1004648.1 hypothetical protein HUJ05_005436 [Dendroctonus ponderosae]